MVRSSIHFFDPYTLLVQGPKGIFRLNCPFSVRAVRKNGFSVEVGEMYWVDEIEDDPVERIIYITASGTFPYSIFEIPGNGVPP